MKTFFKIQVFFEESHKKLRADSDQVINWLISKGFDVRRSGYADTFYVDFNEQNKVKKETFRNNLDLYLLAFGERNCSDCAVLITEEFQSDEEPEIRVWGLVPPSEKGMEYFREITKDDPELLCKLNELRLFYFQLESRIKFIYGLSLLEKWFDAKPEHLLSHDEQQEAIGKIEELSMDDKKKERIVKLIKDTNYLAKKIGIKE